MARWVAWATDMVERWPDDGRDAPFDVQAGEEGFALAASVNAILGAAPHRS